MAAARVGGIYANSARPAAFIRNNLLFQDNVIDAAHRSGVAEVCVPGVELRLSEIGAGASGADSSFSRG